MVIQNNVSKLWNIKRKIVSRRQHQGLLTNSYVIKASQTGRQKCQLERHIRALVANGNANGIDIDHDDMAANASFSVSGVTVKSALKWKSSFPRTLTGEEEQSRSQGGTALPTGCGSQTGSPVGLAHNEDTQPPWHQEEGRSVGFSPIIQVRGDSGEETFQKEFLRNQAKESKAPFKNEVWDVKTSN